MKKALICSLLAIMPSILLGTFAPINTLEPDGPIVMLLEGGAYFDSNIFSSNDNKVDTLVLNISPKIIFKQEIDGTDFRAFYDLDMFVYEDRPTEDKLYNHNLGFSIRSKPDDNVIIDISDNFIAADNPESLLDIPLVPDQPLTLQTDQSFKSNVFNARANIGFDDNFFGIGKFRYDMMSYDIDELAALLDKDTVLVGAEFHYSYTEVDSFFLESRYQNISYDNDGITKDSESLFLLAGAKMKPYQDLDANVRIGVENRDRITGNNDNFLFADCNFVYHKDADNFLSGGIVYQVDEADDVINNYDREVAKLYLNVQRKLSDAIIGAMTVSYADSSFNGRNLAVNGAAPSSWNIDEQDFKVGLSAAYQYDENLSFLAYFDYDNTDSDDPIRNSNRTKIGVFVRYSFGIDN